MKIVLQKSENGMEGYISTYAVHGEYLNTLEPMVCKEVGAEEYDEFLNKVMADDRFIVEKMETVYGEMPEIHVSEKRIPHFINNTTHNHD